MKFISKKKLRREIKRLEAQVKSLREERDTPLFYNKYDGEEGNKTPLWQVSLNAIKALEPQCYANKVHTASDILAHKDETEHFILFMETNKGVFARFIEKESEKEMEVGDTGFVLDIHWAPIFVGKSATIYDTMIVHRDRVLMHVEDMQDKLLTAGDELRINYTFKE